MISYFQELKSHTMDYKHIYTDVSKDDMKVGCAVVSDDFSETMQIPIGSSIFTAEAKAIDLALDLITNCETSNKFVIFSDSLSVLKSLDHTSSKNPLIQKLLEKHHDLAHVMKYFSVGSLATLALLAMKMWTKKQKIHLIYTQQTPIFNLLSIGTL